jgi:hypothetical protein
MDYKDWAENQDISVAVAIYLNDEKVFAGGSFDIDGAIDLLGKAERADVIGKALENQFELESVDDIEKD